MEKTTKRDNFNAIIVMATEAGRDDIVAFAEAEIALLDKRAETAKARKAAKAAEPDELKDAVAAALTSEPQTIADLLEAITIEGATASKVVARLTKLVAEGVAIKSEIRIPKTEEAKARKASAYARA